MKTNRITTICAAVLTLSAATLATSCSDERELTGGEGILSLTATVKSDVTISRASRAETSDELAEKSIVWISNSKGAVRKYNGLAEIPAGGITLLSDHYVAEVWTGDSVSASFDQKCFKGREEFDITNGNTTRVNITCKVANTVASVVYDDKVDELISNYTMTVGHKRGDLVFEGRDERKGYYMMPSYDKNLQWNLEGTLNNGTVYTRSGVIENVKPATEYIIKVSFNGKYEDDTTGNAYFDIIIDERAIDVEDEIEITLAPQFEGQGFDINEPLVGEVGKFTRKSVLVYGTGNLTSVIIETPELQPLIGGNDVDLFNMSTTVADILHNDKITYSYTYDPELDGSLAKINFEEGFLNSLGSGEFPIIIRATDSFGKTTQATFTVATAVAPVKSNDIDEADVWATHATVTGKVQADDASNPGIAYRKVGESSWTRVNGTVTGTTYSAKLEGLTPGTKYEYIAVCDGFEATKSGTFTTEAALQLPNAGFEEWSTHSDKALMPMAEGGQMFWDTGNHGSQKMSKNVTVNASDKVHSGSYSAKLCSQFVGVGTIGKFAAGNIFIGEYLGTQGTDGVLGWGRSFTSRPTSLKGYLHYTSAVVNYPAAGKIETGEMDRGIIYIAILDGYTSEFEGKNYPVIVKTKTQEFFDKNSEHVIGYGELVLTQSTTGDAMVEFNVPITYLRPGKAVNIMLTASASQFGDYFAGGASTLYLDDLQLVY